MKKTLILLSCIVLICGLFLVSCQKKEETAQPTGQAEPAKEAEVAQPQGEPAPAAGEPAKDAAAGYGDKAKEAVPGHK